MKKILKIAIACILSLGLMACGKGVDTTPMSEAYDTANTAYIEFAEFVKSNTGEIHESWDGVVSDTKKELDNYAEILDDAKDLIQEDMDKYISDLRDMPFQLGEGKASIQMELDAEKIEASDRENEANKQNDESETPPEPPLNEGEGGLD